MTVSPRLTRPARSICSLRNTKQPGALREWRRSRRFSSYGGTGFMTNREASSAIHRRRNFAVVQEFAAIAPEDARARLKLPGDVLDWKVADAQADIFPTGRIEGVSGAFISSILSEFGRTTWKPREFLGWPVQHIAGHFGEYLPQETKIRRPTQYWFDHAASNQRRRL